MPAGWPVSVMTPFATPKAYLDNQCTYPPDADKGRETGLRVLKSTVRSGAYYAACQSYDAEGPKEIFAIIRKLHAEGITVLLVEQNAKMALSIADRAYVLETGSITMEGDAKDLLHDEKVRKAYLGA